MLRLLLLLFIFHSTFCRAQILNIEEFRIDKDTADVWTGNVGAGFSTKKQQTNITTLNASSTITYFSENHSYMNINSIKFVGVEGSKSISEGYTHLRMGFLRKKFFSYEPFVQFQYDLGRGLIRRDLVGMSFRIKIFSTPKTHVSFNSGAMYEHEIWQGNVLRFPIENKPGYAETEFIKSVSHIYLRGDLSKNVYLFLVTYYQARFDNFFKPRIITDLQLNFRINKYFTLSNQFTSTLDAAPILDANHFIYSLNTNLLLKF